MNTMQSRSICKIGSLVLAAILVELTTVKALAIEPTGFNLTYKSVPVKDAVAYDKAIKPDGSAYGFALEGRLSKSGEFTKNIIGEFGYEYFAFKTTKFLTGGTSWHETYRSGNVSYGYPVDDNSTSVSGHGLHAQVGYRYSFTKDAKKGFFSALEGSIGYNTIFGVKREAGDNDKYTDKVTEKMSFKSSPYIQPRFIIGWGTDAMIGIQAAYTEYINADFNGAWSLGLLFGQKF